MAAHWTCFRCGRVNSPKIRYCECGTPQQVDPDPEYQEDNSWIVVVTITIIAGLLLPVGIYFLL